MKLYVIREDFDERLSMLSFEVEETPKTYRRKLEHGRTEVIPKDAVDTGRKHGWDSYFASSAEKAYQLYVDSLMREKEAKEHAVLRLNKKLHTVFAEADRLTGKG